MSGDPLRTKKLTEEVPDYVPRTVYRHARRLAELGLVEREEVAGVPSTVIHSLSPAGRDLRDLVVSAAASLPPAGDGEGPWTACGLLGKMWACGWLEELAQGARSTTDLGEATAEMTFHQASRLTHQLLSWQLLEESAGRGQRKRYQLSERARRSMALVAGLGRWRQRHVAGAEEGGLTVGELASVLRTSLPLLRLPGPRDRRIKLGIVGATGVGGERGSTTLAARLAAGGAVRCVGAASAEDAWAIGTVATWLGALLDGEREPLRVGGDGELVDDCLRRLHEELRAAPADVGAR